MQEIKWISYSIGIYDDCQLLSNRLAGNIPSPSFCNVSLTTGTNTSLSAAFSADGACWTGRSAKWIHVREEKRRRKGKPLMSVAVASMVSPIHSLFYQIFSIASGCNVESAMTMVCCLVITVCMSFVLSLPVSLFGWQIQTTAAG